MAYVDLPNLNLAKMVVALNPSEQDPELPSMILVILAKSAAES